MNKIVYMAFASDVLNPAHLKIIQHGKSFGQVVVGVLTDKAICEYKQPPRTTFDQRVELVRSLAQVDRIIAQHTASYEKVLNEVKPDIVIHGTDWRFNRLSTVRSEVLQILGKANGQLIEIPYDHTYDQNQQTKHITYNTVMGAERGAGIYNLLQSDQLIEIIEVHSAMSAMIVESCSIKGRDNKTRSFDGLWSSSLTDSTVRCMPDIELVDSTARLQTIDQIFRVTRKPMIYDADTGGKIEHIPYLVAQLEKYGVSAMVIEDKRGLKKNSLFGTDVLQEQETIEKFQEKISVSKNAQITNEFLVIARIESLILNKGMEDALQRASAFTDAGADGIMIHSRKNTADEIFQFIEEYHKRGFEKPLMVVPSSFNNVKREEWSERGVRIVCHANHMLRASYPAMEKVAESILYNGRSLEAEEDGLCMSIDKILNLIPGTK